ncbi:MAG: hypothetical protein ACOX7R_06700 [Acetivibrionales bacterium]
MGILDYFFMGRSGNKSTESMESSMQKKISEGIANFNEEFSQEVAAEEFETDHNDPNNSYSDNGVQLESAVNPLKLVYKGILAENGAEKVDAVIGYGNNLKWEDIEEYPMRRTDGNSFELIFSTKRQGNINIAFRDSAGNWDNNSGMNYSFIDEF